MRNDDLSSDPEELLDALPEGERDLLRHVSRLRESDELDRARQLLERALGRSPSPTLRKAHGQICIESGNFEAALEVLQPLCAPETADADALLLYARASAWVRRFDVARDAVQRASAQGASRESVQQLRRQIKKLARLVESRDRTEKRKTERVQAPDPADAGADMELVFDRLLEESDAATPGESPSDIQETTETPISDDLVLEEAEGPDTDENPFEEADDTVLDEPSHPVHDDEAAETGSTGGPPAPPGARAEGTNDRQRDRRGGDEYGETVDHEYGETDDYKFDETLDHEYDSDSLPEQQRDAHEEGRLPEGEAEDSDVYQLSTNPGEMETDLDDLLIEQSEEHGDTDAFDAIETQPVSSIEEERDDVQVVDAGPTKSIDLDEVSSSDSDDEIDQTEEIEFGTTSLEEESAPGEEEESETTIEIDESLQVEESDILQSGEPPLQTTDEFDASTDPEVPSGGRDAKDSRQLGERDEPGDDEAPTAEEVPTARSQQPVVRRNSEKSDSEAPTDPEVPTASEYDGLPEDEILTDPQRDGERLAAGREGKSARGRSDSQQPNRRQLPEASREGGATEAARPGAQGNHPEGRGPRSQADPEEAPPGAANRDRGSRRSDAGRQNRSGRPQQPRSKPPAGRTSEPTPGRGRSSRLHRARLLTRWLPSGRFGLIAGATVAAVGLLFVAVAGTVAKFDAAELTSTLDEVESARSTDTYAGWTDSLERAKEASAVAPGFLRRGLHAVGSLLPVGNPTTVRAKLRWEHAYNAAVVEYRFEAFGNRSSSEVADRAFRDGATPAQAAATRVYRLLAQGQSAKALDRAQTAIRKFEGHRRLENALLEALLHTERAGEIASKARSIREARDQLTVHERYLLARAARYDNDASSEALLEELVDRYSPDHLDAKISRVRVLSVRGKHQRSTALGRRLNEQSSESAAPYQLARLRMALGDAYRALNEHARAEEQYRSAIDAQPNRTSVYLPLIDLFIADGRIDEAREQLQRARSRAQVTPDLRIRSARLEFLEGRFQSALQLLSGESDETLDAPVLRGRLLLELGRYESARKVLNSLASTHQKYPAAKSLELVSRARMGVADAETVLGEMEKLRARSPADPVVLRSAARIRLHFARTASGKQRREYLDRAQTLLEQATEAESERALQYYLLCERHMLADRATRATAACRKAQERNASFLPGLLTVAKLRLAKGEVSSADTLLARLYEEFEQRWDVAALRIRSAVRNRKLEVARKLLDSWLDQPESESDEYKLYEGLVAFARADYAKAVGYFEKARTSARHEKEASLYYAHSLARLGELEEAEDVVRDLTTSARWRAPGWLVFGEVRRRQEREDDALENLDLAEKHYDSDFAPPWRIAHLYAERARTVVERDGWDDPRVLENLTRGKERGDSESPEIQFPLGLYYFKGPEPDYARAATHFEKVIEVQPYRCRAVGALLEIYRERNNDEKRKRIERIHEQNCE